MVGSTLIILFAIVVYFMTSRYISKQRAEAQGKWLDANERTFILYLNKFETITIPQNMPVDRIRIHIRAATPVIGGVISGRDLDLLKNHHDYIRQIKFGCFHDNLLETTIECPIETQGDSAAFLIITNQKDFPPDRNDIFVNYSWHSP